jgi:RNase P subunit RPR2
MKRKRLRKVCDSCRRPIEPHLLNVDTKGLMVAMLCRNCGWRWRRHYYRSRMTRRWIYPSADCPKCHQYDLDVDPDGPA